MSIGYARAALDPATARAMAARRPRSVELHSRRLPGAARASRALHRRRLFQVRAAAHRAAALVAGRAGDARRRRRRPADLTRVRRILLIRHGETAGNAARIVQKPDIPLSPRGEAQAAALARRLAGEGVAQILSSDLARAAATAERLRAATGAPLGFDPLLQERNFGDVRGTPYDALGFDLFAPDYAPPNGETWEVFHARVDRAWERVRALSAATDRHARGGDAWPRVPLARRAPPGARGGHARARAVGEHLGDHRGRASPVARQPAELHRAPRRGRRGADAAGSAAV